jgi:hypothetical protein
MPKVIITSHHELPAHNGQKYRRWEFRGTIDDYFFAVEVEDGQYEYTTVPKPFREEGGDDEPIQIAIGECMEEYSLDPGVVHR